MLLDSMRKGAASWLAKILLGILTLSFAVWGIADVLRNWGQNASLAKVGTTEIQPAEFQRVMQNQLDQISRQFGRRLTPDQARMFGIDSRVLSQLIGSAALDNYASDLSLGLSAKSIVDQIEKEPTFAGPDGKFDPSRLQNILRQIGYTERGFIDERRKEEVREQITSTVGAAAKPPASLIDIIYRYREETRVAQAFTIDASKLKIPDPTPDQLKSTYEEHKSEYVIPEYRKVGVLLLTMEEVKKRVPVSEEAIKAEYDQNRARYEIAEQRRVQQIPFKNHADAEAAAQAIAAGKKTFEDVAKEQNAKDADIDLGLVTKAKMLDQKVADAAFSLAKGKVSDAVDGRFATFIVRVTEIVPGRTRTFDEVKGEIRDQLAANQANKTLSKLHDDADDLRGAGKTLKEIADQLKLTYLEVPAVDRNGNAPDGKPAFEGPDAARIVEIAFSDQSSGGDAVDSADNGYIYADNLGVTPAKQKPYEDVEPEVKATWTASERARAAASLAETLVERAGKGEAMDKLAAEAGGTLTTTKPFKRTDKDPGLPPAAVQRVFILARGAVASAEAQGGATRVVFKVLQITPPPPPTQQQTDSITNELNRGMQTDAIAGLMAGLQDRYGVSVNEATFRRITGADAQQ